MTTFEIIVIVLLYLHIGFRLHNIHIDKLESKVIDIFSATAWPVVILMYIFFRPLIINEKRQNHNQ